MYVEMATVYLAVVYGLNPLIVLPSIYVGLMALTNFIR